jgi:hypothetical protein
MMKSLTLNTPSGQIGKEAVLGINTLSSKESKGKIAQPSLPKIVKAEAIPFIGRLNSASCPAV